MTRILIWTTLALTALWFAAGFMLQLELSEPGVSVFDRNGVPLGRLYHALVQSHQGFAQLAMMALGLSLGARALAGGARWTHAWFWPGLGLFVLLLLLAIGSLLPGSAQAAPPGGWVLYPPLSGDEPRGLTTLIEWVLMALPVTWAMSHLSLALLCLGILSTYETATRPLALGGYAILPATGLFYGAIALQFMVHPQLLPPDALPFPASEWIAAWPILGLFILATALSGIFVLQRGAAYFCAGAALATLGIRFGMTLIEAQTGRVYHDTYYIVAHTHWVAGLFMLFVFFGVLDLWLRPHWHIALRIVHALALTAAFAAMTVPQFMLGRQGMPRRYLDYPDAFATWQDISAHGSRATAALVLVGILTMVLTRTKAAKSRN